MPADNTGSDNNESGGWNRDQRRLNGGSNDFATGDCRLENFLSRATDDLGEAMDALSLETKGSDMTITTRRRLLATIIAAMLAIPMAAFADQSDLAEIRRASAKYHRLEVAVADGYELGYRGIITGCISHPTAGAMGYHYFRSDLIDDPAVDPLQPEGLLYAPGPNGKLKLVAVEWVVPGPVPPEPDAEPPSVLGTDLHVLNPILGWYIHHAWIWNNNPAGMFEDWNPRVICP